MKNLGPNKTGKRGRENGVRVWGLGLDRDLHALRPFQ